MQDGAARDGSRRRTLRAMLLAAAALPLAATSFAQSGAPAANPPASMRSASTPPQQQQLYRGTQIIGKPVRDTHDRKIGEIKDLLLDGGRGEIAYAVLRFGDGPGAGRKWHAVPWRALEPVNGGKYYVLQADRETISMAPGFDKAHWPDMTDSQWSADTDRYWSRMVGRGSAGNNSLPPPSGQR